MDQLTDNEKKIIGALRTLNPFERVVIEADRSGKPNMYVMIRTTQVVLSYDGIEHVKAPRQSFSS